MLRGMRRTSNAQRYIDPADGGDMANIVRAVAFANNEIAFLTWEVDQDAIPGSLGFLFVREYLDANDQVVDERPLASYVAFKGRRCAGAGTRPRAGVSTTGCAI
jgi:hypothetical protein